MKLFEINPFDEPPPYTQEEDIKRQYAALLYLCKRYNNFIDGWFEKRLLTTRYTNRYQIPIQFEYIRSSGDKVSDIWYINASIFRKDDQEVDKIKKHVLKYFRVTSDRNLFYIEYKIILEK